MTDPTTPLQIDTLLVEARRRAGLENLGPEWILESLGAYVYALRTEADLTAAGAIQTSEIIIRSLVNRLRMIDAIRQHPEILDEDLKVLVAIIGLPRTGSTLLQRILASIPGINGVRWWELQNFAPFPGEVRGQPTERLRFAEQMVADWLAATPEFAAIHPLSATQVDEESILLHNMFCGALEFRAPIPSYVAWQCTADFRDAYADLRTTLKFLQWQEPARRGKPWVLKAPEHMLAPEALLMTFPDCKVIVTHRNPLQVIPSICSMWYTIQRLAVAQPDRVKIGQAIRRRWGPTLERFTTLRDRIGDDRFVDINYRDLLKNPVGGARKALAAVGMALDAQGEVAINTWLEENSRDQRASHEYTAGDYGLSERELENDFANYIRRFITA
jgi:Sulfotransferase family